jgi:hypothetical protein
VASGLAAGNYTLVYKICEIGNPTNCATASAGGNYGFSNNMFRI